MKKVDFPTHFEQQLPKRDPRQVTPFPHFPSFEILTEVEGEGFAAEDTRTVEVRMVEADEGEILVEDAHLEVLGGLGLLAGTLLQLP